MKTKNKPAITPEQALNNFRLLTELSDRNTYAQYRAAVNEICEEVISRGIAMTIPLTAISRFPEPDYDAGVCEAGPSIGYNRDLSPVEVCGAFAANPTAMHIEMPGGWQVRSAIEGPGIWRICKDIVNKRQKTTRIGKEISRHNTFAAANLALEKFIQEIGTATVCGDWSIYCGNDEQPWVGMGVSK